MRSTPKLIIADDTQMIRQALKIALVNTGFTGIIEARNGREVTERIKQNTFDLIICDWEMPEMAGIEALHYIRQDPLHKNVPFVMVTSEADPEKIRQAMAEGVTDYIVKPVKPDLFIGKIMFILHKQRKHLSDKTNLKRERKHEKTTQNSHC